MKKATAFNRMIAAITGLEGVRNFELGAIAMPGLEGVRKKATPSNPLIAAITGLEGVRNFEPHLVMAVHITKRLFEVRSFQPPFTP